jgi:aryl-alcohol dehydrogenase-like predicted oxidoreductase
VIASKRVARYTSPMRLRALGKVLPGVSELGLGTWGLSGDGYGSVASDEQDRVIDRAVALGITLFETADVYGDGVMEERLGQRLPAGTHVVTKIGTDRASSPPQKRFTPKYLEEAFDRSRERLKREVVDVVLLHNPVAATVDSGEGTRRHPRVGRQRGLVGSRAGGDPRRRGGPFPHVQRLLFERSRFAPR